MNIIGLDKIQDWIAAYTFNVESFPHALILEGPYGGGRHLISNLIAEKLDIEEVEDITDNISRELIDDIYLSPTQKVLIIDGSKISKANQQKILKLIEEPPVNSYIIIICENKWQVLETVRNRCFIKKLDTYTQAELSNFGSLPHIIANTPGKQLEWSSENLLEIENICNNILAYINTVNYPNLLSISSRFKYTDKDEGYSFSLFLELLKRSTLKAYQEGLVPFSIVLITQEFVRDCYLPNVNKKNLLEAYLTDIRYDTNRRP